MEATASQDAAWYAAHEGHEIDKQMTVAYCATCDSFHTLDDVNFIPSR